MCLIAALAGTAAQGPAPAVPAQQAASAAASEAKEPWGALRFRHVGPEGNRRSPSPACRRSNIDYAGAASGGIFKTTDGGVHWQPIFDDQPVSSIGALAVAPSDPNVVWAGTGEAFIRSNVSIGWGIYKSTDAGKTWTHMGLDRPAASRAS